MTHNLSHSSHRAQPSFWLLHKQPLEQHLDLLRKFDVRRKLYLLILDGIIYLLDVTRIEGGITSDQLIQQGTQTVIIHRKRMPRS